AGDRSDHGDALVEGAGDEGRLAGAGDAGDDELGLIDRGVGLNVVDDARDAPGPGAEQAPVVVGIGGAEARGAIGPASVGEAEGGVLAAVAVVEGDEGVAVLDGLFGLGDLLSGARRSEASATAAGCCCRSRCAWWRVGHAGYGCVAGCVGGWAAWACCA